MRKVVIGIILAFASYGHAQTKCAPALPADVCQFETKVYTGIDFKNTAELKRLMIEFKNILMTHANDTALIQDHILTLGGQIVEESYDQRAPKNILALADGKGNLLKMLKQLRQWESKNGQIVPLDWQLPTGVVIGIASLDRSYDVSTDRLRYGVSFFAPLDRALDIEQFKVTRFGGSVVIDKSAGIGSWNEGILPQSVYRYFSASAVYQDTPMTDGLYLLSLKVKGQKAVDGWFFLHGTSSTSPSVQQPQVNESFVTGNPTFRFQDFRSNFISPSDSRKLSLSVYHEGDNKQVWKTSAINSKNVTSLTLGQESNQTGVSRLDPGLYRLNLAFEERSYFGDLTVGRLMNTTIPFSVTK